MSDPLHLVRRFLGSLSPRPLDPSDDAWVRDHLLDGEVALWARMPRADRKHAAGVARTTVELLGDDTPRPIVAAAALHDVGKIESDLSTVARAGVTVLAAVAGRDRLVDQRNRGRWRTRMADYLEHDVIGAALLAEAGSDVVTVRWAREHHLPSSRRTVDAAVAAALSAADDD